MTSLGFTSIPEIVAGSGNIMAVTIDPGEGGAREIVHITAHDTAAAAVTVERGCEGTAAVAHDADVPWVHAVTAWDFREGDPPDGPYDDEFDGTSSVSWSLSPTAPSLVEINEPDFSPGCLHLIPQASAQYQGIVQSAPGTYPYTITTRVLARGLGVNFHRGGGILLAPTGWSGPAAVVYYGWAYDGSWRAGRYSTNSSGTFASSGGVTAGIDPRACFRAEVLSATSARFSYSEDGTLWNVAETLTLPFTPGLIGLANNREGATGSPGGSVFEFFRVTL